MPHQRLIICTLLLALAACENDPREVNALTRKVVEQEQGKDIKAFFSQNARQKAYLTAPVMNRVKSDTLYAEFPKSLRVEFFDEQEKLQNVVTANYARYFETQGKVLLQDSVVVYNVLGDTLLCKTLWWYQAEESFYTDEPVVINTRTQKLVGTGFWAKSDFSRYTIKNTRGPVLLPEQGNGPADSSRTDSLAPRR